MPMLPFCACTGRNRPGTHNRLAAACTQSPMTTTSTKPLQSITQLPSAYQGILLDQFGVLHDGIKPYEGTIEAVQYLADQGRQILLLSNSSRRSGGALGNLQRMGFNPDNFLGVLTSGEVTFQGLLSRKGAPWDILGNTCLHITWGDRGAISLEGLNLTVTQDIDKVKFILAHGTEALGAPGSSEDSSRGPPTSCTLDQLNNALQRCAERARGAPPMIVANPDLVTVSGKELRVMPGTLAKNYQKMGGTIFLMGKPAPVIYHQALQMMQLAPTEVIAIGDSLEHDIAGGASAGVDTMYVAGGIHAKETLQEASGGFAVDMQGLKTLSEHYSVTATFALPYFRL